MFNPQKPASIFDGDNAFQFAIGINNAYKLRYGLGGDVSRPDLGVCMLALSETEQMIEDPDA